MRSRLMVRFHLRQLNCRGFPLSVLLCNGPLSSGFYDILAIRFFIQEHKERTPDR